VDGLPSFLSLAVLRSHELPEFATSLHLIYLLFSSSNAGLVAISIVVVHYHPQAVLCDAVAVLPNPVSLAVAEGLAD
jgi:hypothetical protein